MSDEDRIKLAEAMGRNPGMYAPNFDTPIFSPFTDANDDYAVLEWIKNGATWTVGDFSDRVCDELRWECWEYKVGDFARAALKVLETVEDTTR